MKKKRPTRKRAEAEPIRPGDAIEKAWRATIERRLAELESGRVKGIPGHEVFSHVRRMLKQTGVQKTRELLSQRKRGPRKPFAVRLANGERVRISDPQCIAITPGTLFIARSTGAIARIDLREIEAIENLPDRARKRT